MLYTYNDFTNSQYKAEILLNNEWIDFFILNKKKEACKLDEIVIKSLPTTLNGRILTNTVGYNPYGWFKEISVDIEEVRFTKNKKP